MTTGRINQVTTFTVARQLDNPRATKQPSDCNKQAATRTGVQPLLGSPYPATQVRLDTRAHRARAVPTSHRRHRYHDPQPYQFAQSTSASVPDPECIRVSRTHTQPERAPFMTKRPQKACKHIRRSLTNTRTTIKIDSNTVYNCKLPTEGAALLQPTGSELSLLLKLHTHRPQNS